MRSAAPAPARRKTNRRLALRSAGYLVFAFPLVLIAYQGLPIPLGATFPMWRGLIVALILLLLTRHLMRSEGRSPSDLGLSFSTSAATHLVLGLAGGGVLFGLATLLLGLWLPIEWQLKPTLLPAAIFGALLFHLVTNACEELAWRGYAFDGLMRVLGHWPAQIIVALAAAFFHVLSGWEWQVALISTTAGSLLFALVFIRWRSIPAAIGVHAAWNWTGDLVLSPGAATSILTVTGPEDWSRSQWGVAQAIYVGVTLLACGGLLRSLRASSLHTPRAAAAGAE
jgi:membrane protease YdiL (CAAX protease family)